MKNRSLKNNLKSMSKRENKNPHKKREYDKLYRLNRKKVKKEEVI